MKGYKQIEHSDLLRLHLPSIPFIAYRAFFTLLFFSARLLSGLLRCALLNINLCAADGCGLTKAFNPAWRYGLVYCQQSLGSGPIRP
jgi:hypothetical protein